MKERIKSFDAIKFMAIFLVIWGHTFNVFLSTTPYNTSLYRYIYSFHMPLFMMISGYFASSSVSMSPKSFLLKKFRQLLYPCIAWGIIIWIFLESKYIFHYSYDKISILGLIKDLYWFADFWFLKSCFICYCLAYFSKRYCKIYWIPISVIASQAIMLMSVSFMYPCFVIGIVLKEDKELWKRITSRTLWILILFFLMLIFWNKNAWINSHGIPQGILITDWYLIMKIGFFRIYRMLIGIIGALAVMSLFTISFKKKDIQSPFINLCCQWGKYTLEVYILQAILLERILSNYIYLDSMNSYLFCLVTPIISFVILVICLYTVKIINSSTLLRKLLFGKQ